jgi:HlyD family secretion protein
MSVITVPRPALISDQPGREVRIGLIVAATFFIGLLGWAAFARVDSAVYAHGQIEVLGNRQAVQHPEGGVISALKVKEGDQVVAGQVLVELSAPQVVAEEQALATQYVNLVAVRARLLAERTGTPLTTPVEFTGLNDRDAAEANRAMALQRQQMAARSQALANEQAIYERQRSQLSQQIEGYNHQIAANRDQRRLIEEEMDGMKSLADRGFASQNTVRALERNAASLDGSYGEYQAMIARAQEAIGQVELQIVGLGRKQGEDVVEALRTAEGQIGDIEPRLTSARSRLAQTQVRSPATGQVVGLSVFTVGGVVASGQKLMDVVPHSAALRIVTQVSPDDADDLAVGQTTEIHFSGLHDRALPRLSGKVVEFSADSFADERTGARYFRAEVAVPPQEWEKLTRQGKASALRPGLPVDVIIPLHKRTVLDYIIDPLRQSIWRSMREH